MMLKKAYLLLSVVLLFSLSFSLLHSKIFAQSISIFPSVETDAVLSATDAADDPLIWIHPTDPSKSTVMGNDKKGPAFEVYDINSGARIQRIVIDVANTDIRYNFPLGGQKVALVTGFSSTKGGLVAWRVNPTTRALEDVTASGAKVRSGGGTMYHSQTTGRYYWISNTDGQINQYELKDNGTGKVSSTLVRTFNLPTGTSPTEGSAADDILGHLYVSVEPSGLYKIPAEPNAGNTTSIVDKPISQGGHFTPDIEGLTLYYKSDGTGYLFASSQGSNSYNVYRREGSNTFVGNFPIVDGNGIDGSSATDGIDVTNFPLGTKYPKGLFVAQDGANFDGGIKVNQNFKLVDFGLIANRFQLASDTSWDPRKVGAGNVTPGPTSPPATNTPTPTPITNPTKTPTPTPPSTSCSVIPPTNTGRVTLSTTTTAGTYRVWSRMKAANVITNDSFYVQIGSNCPILVGNTGQISSSTWTWVDFQNGSTTNKIDLNLASGNHVVTLIGNELGVSVDKILMTKNLSCIPTGTSGDNCPAEIPTPTIPPSPTVTPTKTPTPTPPPPTKTPTPTPTIIVDSCTRVTPELSVVPASRTGNPGDERNYTVTVKNVDVGLCPPRVSMKLDFELINLLWDGGFGPNRVAIYDVPDLLPGQQDSVVLHVTPRQNATPGSKPVTVNLTGSDGSGNRVLFATKEVEYIVGSVSPTPVPNTPTLTPNATVLSFSSIKLHGIGKGGDNSIDPNNPPLVLGNPNPLRTTRTLTVELINSSGITLPVASGNMTFKSLTGDFGGDIVVDSTIPSGNYLIKIKSPQYLRRQLIGIITVTKGSINQMPVAILQTGDINTDNNRRIDDYNILIGCYSDLLPAKDCDPGRKLASDLSDDGNVNADDYNLFIRELSVASGD